MAVDAAVRRRAGGTRFWIEDGLPDVPEHPNCRLPFVPVMIPVTVKVGFRNYVWEVEVYPEAEPGTQEWHMEVILLAYEIVTETIEEEERAGREDSPD
jgi:hypothetical protein